MCPEPLSSIRKPLLLDAFCGAGGCTKGFQRAGFFVVGVDIVPQPNYCGDDFIQGDALDVLGDLLTGEPVAGYWLHEFSAVHASPPCPAYSRASHYHGVQDQHPDLYEPTKRLLRETGLPWIIENVEGSPLRRDVVLCGEMFGLRLHRHRVFEIENFFLLQPRHHEDAADAMGIDWKMSRRELANAIPPAYTEFIGQQLFAALSRGLAA